jgi:hypothetical protein
VLIDIKLKDILVAIDDVEGAIEGVGISDIVDVFLIRVELETGR